MKPVFLIAATLLVLVATGCAASRPVLADSREQALFEQKSADSVTIADAESKYEIVIIEPGFYNWLVSIAKPEGYYSQTFLENRNALYVINWNNRVLDPASFNPNLYEMQIDYDPSIDYGYEVNYKLYNYFIYFQRKYNQRLGPWIPRI